MKKRIEWIDLCKIITMIIVCYDHTIQSIAPDEALKNSFFIGTISFHMPLFMILSGYFINPKRMRTDKITTSCFSKFKHLMVPAFSWQCLITIRDNGGGIMPEVQDKIFVPFFTTKTSGSGIGLILCNQIMNRHVGKITVQSTVGQGSCFTLQFG